MITEKRSGEEQGISLRFTMEEIDKLSHSNCGSFLTEQFDRLDFESSDLTLKAIQELDDPKTCSFYFTNDFLHAKVIAEYFKAQGEQTAIFFDTYSENDYVIWVTIPFCY
jgi:hypothetical protein